MLNADVVDRLVLAALNAMEDVAVKDNVDEKVLLSAAYTIAMRVTKEAIKRNELLRPSCQQAAQLLLMQTAGGQGN